MNDDSTTFDSFAPAVGRGFVEHSVQQPVQPRMHFLLAPVCGHVCAHRFGGFNRRGRARYKLSQNFTAKPRHTTGTMYAAYLLSGATRDAWRTSIISKTENKVSWFNCVTAEKVIPVSFFYAVVRQRPRIFRAYNRPRYVKMHKDDDNSAVRNREDFLFIRIIILSILDLDRYNIFSPSNWERLRTNISYCEYTIS